LTKEFFRYLNSSLVTILTCETFCKVMYTSFSPSAAGTKSDATVCLSKQVQTAQHVISPVYSLRTPTGMHPGLLNELSMRYTIKNLGQSGVFLIKSVQEDRGTVGIIQNQACKSLLDLIFTSKLVW
jgi:hypothetical protein